MIKVKEFLSKNLKHIRYQVSISASSVQCQEYCFHHTAQITAVFDYEIDPQSQRYSLP